MPGMESQLSAPEWTLSVFNCKHQTLELNQLIPHITHMVELGGASLGPHGVTQSTTHLWYQMYGRGLKTAPNTKDRIPEEPGLMQT